MIGNRRATNVGRGPWKADRASSAEQMCDVSMRALLKSNVRKEGSVNSDLNPRTENGKAQVNISSPPAGRVEESGASVDGDSVLLLEDEVKEALLEGPLLLPLLVSASANWSTSEMATEE
jgi:hypothetical protein